jgi:hypothetical protein
MLRYEKAAEALSLRQERKCAKWSLGDATCVAGFGGLLS